MNDDAVNQPTLPAAAGFDNMPGPGMFNGRSDGIGWLKRFELWARCRRLTEDTMVAALQLHLVDAAATWADVLADNERDTWTNFRAAFVARYGPSEQLAWQRAGHLWSVRQETDEPALDFVARVQQLARGANVPADMQMSVIVNGLQPPLRSHVLRQIPADMVALQQAVRAAEDHERLASGDANTSAIRRIEQRLEELTLHALTADTNRRHQRSPSPSAERADYRRPPPQRAWRQPQRPRRLPYPNSRAPYTSDRRRTTTPSPVRSPSAERRVAFAVVDDERPGAREPSNRLPPCDSCGRRNHRRDECYFRWAECAACHRVGHLQAVCRSAAAAATSH